jgi:hypothetical protein
LRFPQPSRILSGDYRGEPEFVHRTINNFCGDFVNSDAKISTALLKYEILREKRAVLRVSAMVK